jgi:hypothetical protein
VSLIVHYYFLERGDLPLLLGDPYGTVAPSLCSGIRRNPQRFVLPDGTFFPPGRCVVPWGRASAPAGVAPEALEECVHSCKAFPQRAVEGVFWYTKNVHYTLVWI